MKKNKGKQKIEIKKIMNENDRLITFSKRRSGMYKKLNELITTCGVEAGFLVFSAAGHPFSFGHPEFLTVAQRFLSDNVWEDDVTKSIVEAHRTLRIAELNKNYVLLGDNLEAEQQSSMTLKQLSEGREPDEEWWNVQISALDLEELLKLHELFMELHRSLNTAVSERRDAADPSNLSTDRMGFPGSSHVQDFNTSL